MASLMARAVLLVAVPPAGRVVRQAVALPLRAVLLPTSLLAAARLRVSKQHILPFPSLSFTPAFPAGVTFSCQKEHSASFVRVRLLAKRKDLHGYSRYFVR